MRLVAFRSVLGGFVWTYEGGEGGDYGAWFERHCVLYSLELSGDGYEVANADIGRRRDATGVWSL